MTLGGVASEAVKGLSASPMLLVVALLNLAMLALVFYVGSAQRDERAMMTKLLVECHKK
jgi:uncharacterized membrane protein (DUF4010 family)